MKKDYQIGDLIFAKVKGYPHWPARVCTCFYRDREQFGILSTRHTVISSPANLGNVAVTTDVVHTYS